MLLSHLSQAAWRFATCPLAPSPPPSRFSSTQECSATERLPGFWQVPVWQLIGDDVPFSMDYGE